MRTLASTLIYGEPVRTISLQHISISLSGNMALAGVPVGVLCHYWYIFLDDRIIATGIRAVALKVCWDQVGVVLDERKRSFLLLDCLLASHVARLHCCALRARWRL